jgi:hypothetical protein
MILSTGKPGFWGPMRRKPRTLSSKSGAPFLSSGVVELPDAKAGFRKSLVVRDPDGHAVQIVEP